MTTPTRAHSPERLLKRIKSQVDFSGSISAAISPGHHPAFGTVIFIAHCMLEMRMGRFHAYIFQDLIHKGYVVALAYGKIESAKELYTRIHSSCVTSETLRGCDCDCAKQLEGALEKIARSKAGILFYLIQEGRGVGYVAKARDRMLVQASLDQLSTFEAYKALGLKRDYRNYECIASIYHLLGLKAPLVLLTNNPDKVGALKELNVPIARSERIQFEAGPYNLAYLKSKKETGHILTPALLDASRRALPPEEVEIVKPRSLESAARFIKVASYYLPMKPVSGEIYATRAQVKRVMKRSSLARLRKGSDPLLAGYEELPDGRFCLHINRKAVGRYRDKRKDELSRLLTMPYWFKIHAYYDVVSGQDFVVLEHGKGKKNRTPLVRVHSESIFDRFPLVDVSNRDKLKKSARLIVRHGHGFIVLLYNDGRGAGFGAHALDRMLRQHGFAQDSDESYRSLGVDYDLRDYDAAMRVLRNHLPDKRLRLIVNSPASLARKPEYAVAIHAQELDVEEWIFLE